MTGGVSIKNLNKSFGAITVLHDIELEVEPGEFVVLLGESGCGKSTLLRLVSGLEEDHEGEVWIADRDVTYSDPKDRSIAMVFQSYALYPHMSVFDNIAFGMKVRKTPKAEIAERVTRAAEVLKLDHLLDRKPGQLSGGQRQRVAIGRAMVRDPEVFLFDEPLSNLDAKLRGEMRAEIKRIHQTLQATILYVTHDQIEAMTLADKIVLLNEGRIEQLGSPISLYSDPDTLFAARFIGTPEINTLPVKLSVKDDAVSTVVNGVEFQLPRNRIRGRVRDGMPAMLAIRPEFLDLNRDGAVTTEHKVIMCEPTGSETYVALQQDESQIRLKIPGLATVPVGSMQRVAWDPNEVLLFDPGSGYRL
ncbi:ABC transporter ATP-binding protein [Rhodophyticola sp. CCM32]|uniref:ABC transporter ATP-binding protein n=1 Tax=Rhodophyticola sp. CCM32 TaxID=2916397 RepID=UPI00107F143F|nr:ABC transporter ATP-binding protein [Rhodophyticola sp. CCM32]QBY01222.1 ABC transporter ATP-binding protein [Rhodophyticola sp. CCM32]